MNNGTPEGSVDAAQLLAAKKQLDRLRVSASKDHLAAEAQLCQLCWRMQEQAATDRRLDSAICRFESEVDVAERYFALLKCAGQALYQEGLKRDDALAGASEQYGCHIRAQLPFVLRVFEYYVHQRWSVQTLERTTTLGKSLRSTKDHLASLNDSQSSPLTAPPSVDGRGGDNDDADTHMLRESLTNRIVSVELELLQNRFESRAAERTSEEVWNRVCSVAAATASELAPKATSVDGQTSADYRVRHIVVSSQEGAAGVSTAVSTQVLEQWLFSTDLCRIQRQQVLALLAAVSTDADARDSAGNIADVIFGASLDRSEVEQIFATRSKQRVEDQWRTVALGLLFFVRLFRRAALQVRCAMWCSECCG